MSTQDNSEEPNKYQQYLRRKQAPAPPSARIINRINEIEQKYNTTKPQQEQSTSIFDLKAKIEDLERKLLSEKNLNAVKEESIKHLTEELANQPRKHRDDVGVLKIALEKKEAEYVQLEEKYKASQIRNKQLENMIETYKQSLKQFTI